MCRRGIGVGRANLGLSVDDIAGGDRSVGWGTSALTGRSGWFIQLFAFLLLHYGTLAGCRRAWVQSCNVFLTVAISTFDWRFAVFCHVLS